VSNYKRKPKNRTVSGPKTARVKNNVGRFSGLGSEFDYSQYQQPASVPLTPMQQDKFCVDLYYTDWAAKKIVSIPVEDMLRDGWQYEGLADDQASLLVTLQDSLSALEQIKQAMRLERLVGGCVIFMGIVDGQDDPSKAVNYAALQKGCLKFLNVIPRTRVTNTSLDFDPLSPTYGRPITYWVNGVEVHESRLLLFKGDPLLQVPDSTIMPTQWTRNDGFGVSVLMPLLDDLTRATGSRQAAYQLVQRASVFLFQADTMDLSSTTQGQAQMAKMQNIVNQINLFRGAVVDTQPGQASPITTISPSFGSVPELVMTFLQVLAAAGDIPGSRFFSQAPGGLNAPGDTELENYYGRLESQQKQDLRPKLIKLLKVMGPSALGEDYDAVKIDIIFQPLWSLSEAEQATIRTQDTTNILAMLAASLLSDFEALEELRLRDVLIVEKDAEELEEDSAPETTLDPAADLAKTLAELNPSAQEV
jgi:phage-related protein (TIGR01555 family)